MQNQRDVQRKLIIFSDFDGTVSIGDVGNRLFHHFSDGRSEEAVRRWYAGEIDSRRCLLEEAAAMSDIDEAELTAFIDGFQIDPAFAGFVDFCRDGNRPLYILSDGLDIYINRLLETNGLADTTVVTNRAELAGGRLRFTFPYYDHSCGVCANCKGYHIRRLREDGQTAVYIGDGKSDLCALPEADLVFAKGYLADYCRDNDIDFAPFNDFDTVMNRLRSI